MYRGMGAIKMQLFIASTENRGFSVFQAGAEVAAGTLHGSRGMCGVYRLKLPCSKELERAVDHALCDSRVVGYLASDRDCLVSGERTATSDPFVVVLS